MQHAVLLPPMIAALSCASLGFRKSLVLIVIPILLFLPAYYSHKYAAIPVVNFHNYSLAIVTAALLFGSDRKLLVFQWTDCVVTLYVLLTVYSEYANKSYAEAQNLLAVRLMGVIGPYFCGKACGRSNGLVCGLIVVTCIAGSIIGIVSPFEARLGRNPFDFWRNLWPSSVPWSGALYRFGLRRVAGPFAHPICQGFFFSMIIPLFVWMVKIGYLKSRRARWFIGAGLCAGLLAAGSRGPWIGALLSTGIAAILWRRDRLQILLLGATALVCFALTFWSTIAGYVSIERGQATTQEQETAAYRWEMLEAYIEVVQERPDIGYGKDNIPVVKGLKSIDNQYLFIALTHGMPAAVLFLCCLLLPAAALFSKLLFTAQNCEMTQLSAALCGILSGAIFTQTTVFAGTQTEQILFILIGISVSLHARFLTIEESSSSADNLESSRHLEDTER